MCFDILVVVCLGKICEIVFVIFVGYIFFLRMGSVIEMVEVVFWFLLLLLLFEFVGIVK